jgi:2'-5' RNA ligase
MPSKNSYLCVTLPAPTVDALESLSMDLASSCPQFTPAATPSLHMTFSFLSTTYNTLPASTLLEYHARVLSAVNACRLATLEYAGLQMFPPGKANLIVATFTAPPALHQLHAQLHSLLPRHLQAVNPTTWIPHVTLCKLKATKKDLQEVSRALICTSDNTDNTEAAAALQGGLRFDADEISMGGATPVRARLDWDMRMEGGVE